MKIATSFYPIISYIQNVRGHITTLVDIGKLINSIYNNFLNWCAGSHRPDDQHLASTKLGAMPNNHKKVNCYWGCNDPMNCVITAFVNF